MIGPFHRVGTRRLVSLLLLTLVIVTLTGVVVYQRSLSPEQQPVAIATIDQWANAAASGDLATARDLLVDEPLQRLAFESRWPNMLRVYGIVPGHSLSNIMEQGQSTTATVHFRTGDGAFCMNVLVDQQPRITILNEAGRCPFPPASEAS